MEPSGPEIDARTELVPLSAGHVLEVDIYTTQRTDANKTSSRTIAVLCHPWSWLGGCKDDPVLVNLSVSLTTTLGVDVFVPNSRAVGSSTGRSSFSGQAEATDLEELVKWSINRGEDVDCVLLVGYSHGSLLVSCHPVLSAPIRTYHVLLSYPLSPLPLLTFFHAATYREKLRQLLQEPRARVLVMYGDKDQFTSIDKYQSWVTSFQQTESPSTGGTDTLTSNARAETKMIPGADHFWRGQFNRQMRETIMSWLREQEQSQRP